MNKVIQKNKKLSKKVDNLTGSKKKILELLGINPTSKYVILKTGRHKSNVGKDIKKLIDLGYVKRIDRGVYKVIQKLRGIDPSYPKKGKKQDDLRLHSLEIELRLNSEHHYIIKSIILKNRNLFNVKDNRAGKYCYFDNITLLITRKTIYVYYPKSFELIAPNLKELGNMLYDEIRNTAITFFKRFKISFFKNNRMNFNIRNMHIALIENGIVKEHKGKVNHLKIYDDIDKKPRFLWDWSNKIAELEAVHPEKAFDDADNAKFFMETIKDGKYEKMFNNTKHFFNNKEEISMLELKQVIFDLSKQNRDTAAGLSSIVNLISGNNKINKNKRQTKTKIPKYIG